MKRERRRFPCNFWGAYQIRCFSKCEKTETIATLAFVSVRFSELFYSPAFLRPNLHWRRLRSYIIYHFRFSKSIVPINFAAEAFICYRISRVIFMNRAYGNNIIGSEYRYLQFRRKILLLFDCFFCDGFIQNCRLLSNFYR